VGIVPLLLVAHWRRALPETTRFETLRRRREDAMCSTPPFAPMFSLLRGQPRRFAALAVSVLAAFPETARRTLEEIAPDPESQPPAVSVSAEKA
jgi:hypothetical protein